MNKYIKTDIEQGIQYLKSGIMNVLSGIESGEIEEIILEGPIALKLIIDCAEKRGWKTDPDMDWDWTNGWQIDYWYRMITNNGKFVDISGSVLEGDNVKLTVNHDDE
jgi:hypothetical protein